MSHTVVSLEGDIAREKTVEWEKFCPLIAVVNVRMEEHSVCDSTRAGALYIMLTTTVQW